VTVEYLNPDGTPVVPTFSCEMSRLYPGRRTQARRRTGSSVYVVFRGSGRSVIDGRLFEWGPGDVFVSPSWAATDHEASEVADLFTISDRPLLQAVNLFAEATEAEPQEVREVFEPR
jgi:gentisate 1,2-dioxygenase